MILIREEQFEVTNLVEESNGVKSHYIIGPYMVSETKNRNGRIYPRYILEREVGLYQPLISEKRSISELGHPDTPNINLDRVSHLITSLKVNGNVAEGRSKLLDTPMGKIAKSLLDEGVKLGVSTRGVGSLKMVEGANIVQDDYKMTAIDIVSDPSGPGCFVQGIMENADWIIDVVKGQYQMVEDTQQKIRAANRQNMEKTMLEAFRSFVDNL
ncbi:MAG: primosomal protein [Candidatus Dormibacteria bacterium]